MIKKRKVYKEVNIQNTMVRLRDFLIPATLIGSIFAGSQVLRETEGLESNLINYFSNTTLAATPQSIDNQSDLVSKQPATEVETISFDKIKVTVDPENLPQINPYGEQIVKNAKRYIGIPYNWNGRSRRSLDCLGLVVRAYSDTFDDDWRKYPVDPIAMTKSKYLGSPVEGLDGILREDIDEKALQSLQEGDLIYFLIEGYNESCPRCFITDIDDKSYGGWHTALSLGYDEIIHANPGRKVQEDNLVNIGFDGLFVERREK